MYKLFLGWLLAVNLIGIAAMWLDKRKAQKNLWRIPEKHLFLIAVHGGSLGCIFGMYRFRHKTKHPSFRYGLPLIFFLELGLFLGLYRMFAFNLS